MNFIEFFSHCGAKIIEFATLPIVQFTASFIVVVALIYVLSKEEREWFKEYIKATKKGSEDPIADANAATEHDEEIVKDEDVIKTVYYVPRVFAFVVPRNKHTGKIVWNWRQDN